MGTTRVKMATLRLLGARELGVRLVGSRLASGGTATTAPPKPPKKAAPNAVPPKEAAYPALPNLTGAGYPAVTKTNDPAEYQSPEYYNYNEYSYYDLDEDMMKLRMEAPSTAGKYTSFKAPVSQQPAK